MANVNAQTGLSPVGTVTGAPFNEQGVLYAIANDASNTYAIGDIVKSTLGNDSNGNALVTKVTAASDVPLGVIVGIRVANPGVSLVAQNLDLTKTYISKSSGSYTYVYVVTDPTVVYKVQANTSADTKVGSTAVPTLTADQTSTLSASAPYSSTIVTADAAATAASMFQVVGMSQTPDNVPGAFNDLLVVFNKHQYKQAFGV
jgi:hypothetical protein